MQGTLFHLAFPVHDFKAAKIFYVDGLGCQLGRFIEDKAMILNLEGNQLVAHHVNEPNPWPDSIYPCHFGLIFLELKLFEQCWQRVQEKKLKVYREPTIRHIGKLTEHHSLFLIDPSNNLLEFKYYRHTISIFSEQSGSIGGK